MNDKFKTKQSFAGEKLAYSIINIINMMPNNFALEFLKSLNYILYKEYKKRTISDSQFSRNWHTINNN